MVKNEAEIWALLEQVPDPEIPVLSVVDLGVVRGLTISNSNTDAADTAPHPKVCITITPTYSGCPAMDMIAMNIRLAMAEAGVQDLEIKQQLSPAWTTDWMSENGKNKLKEYGIAPPLAHHQNDELFASALVVPCPRCASERTELVSQFGSTSCKALYRCLDCKEPFDYFKCHK